MLVEENMLDREKINSYAPCEQRRFWSSWPQGVTQGTMESPLSEPCWQDPRSTGVVLQWEAAVSVEQTDPAMECHTSWDASLPTERAVTSMTLSTPLQGYPFTSYLLAVRAVSWEMMPWWANFYWKKKKKKSSYRPVVRTLLTYCSFFFYLMYTIIQ